MEKKYVEIISSRKIDIYEYESHKKVKTLELPREYATSVAERAFKVIKKNYEKDDFYDSSNLPEEISGVNKTFSFFYIFNKNNVTLTEYENILVYKEKEHFKIFMKKKKGLVRIEDCKEENIVQVLANAIEQNKLRLIL